MSNTMFYVEGKPISVEEFVQRLFKTLNLPQLFINEQALREQWQNPMTRIELLKKLEEHGCPKSQLLELQEMIQATHCDLFDVLEYISYARKPITRSERVAQAKSNIYSLLNDRQSDFINFVLANYVQDGIDELDIANLSKILMSKYGALSDAEKNLGTTEEIQSIFIDFQRYLYQEKVG